MNRCILVSNRLPVTYDDKTKKFKDSAGGLVSAIKSLDPKVVGMDFLWMGLMDESTPPELIKELKNYSSEKFSCQAILVKPKDYKYYYNKFSNNVLWPICHYERAMFQNSTLPWKYYVKVNELIASAIIKEAKDNDCVWIHDYHLFLVPGLIKAQRPDLKVGFFLHIPFPSVELFREIPQRKEILASLITCDLIGFHDLSYLMNFKNSIARILGEKTQLINEPRWGGLSNFN